MTAADLHPAEPMCRACGRAAPPGALACEHCGALTHADDLRRLASEAEQASSLGDRARALAAWRSALELLPPDSKQHQSILSKVDALSRAVTAQGSSTDEPKHPWVKRAGALGAVVLLLWKFKFVGAFLLTKGKFLVLGLTKASTFFSMILFFGVYWTAFGWPFALGIVLSIYVHEMGHVAMLRRYGIAATAPMFIPGLGAVVRLKQYPINAAEDARVGMAGPIWGLGAAVVSYVIYRVTGEPVFGAIARLGAVINLFNMVPVWYLDGSRAFSALTQQQRFLAAATLGIAWYFSSEGMLLLLLVVAVFRAFGSNAPKQKDDGVLLQYAITIAVLAAMTTISVPIP